MAAHVKLASRELQRWKGLIAGFTGKDSTEVSDVQMFSPRMGDENDTLKVTDETKTENYRVVFSLVPP